MEALINISFTILFLVVIYFIGSGIEKKHFANIRQREARHRSFPVMTLSQPPSAWKVNSAGIVTGHVVISLDYFKRFLAGLRGLVGGRVKSYEPLMDRGRREAILRMVESARAKGYDAVVNVRLETSRLASARADGKGTAGVEMLAFGTALKIEKDPPPDMGSVQ